MKLDFALDTDLDRVAKTAMSIVSDVRDIDPQRTLSTLTTLCATEPGRMAQVLMCLGVWVDPDDTTDALTRRAIDAAGTRAAA